MHIRDKAIASTDDLNDWEIVVETLYYEELSAHLGHKRYEHFKTGNIRSGKNTKTVRTKSGTVELEVPRHREGKFESQPVKKRQRDITGIEDKKLFLCLARNEYPGYSDSHQ